METNITISDLFNTLLIKGDITLSEFIQLYQMTLEQQKEVLIFYLLLKNRSKT